jgi:hypothetical protein
MLWVTSGINSHMISWLDDDWYGWDDSWLCVDQGLVYQVVCSTKIFVDTILINYGLVNRMLMINDS